LAAGDVVEGRARMLGFGVQGHATATEVNPSCLEKDVIVGVRMRVRVEVDEVADSVRPARVTYRLVADLPDGPLGRVLSFFLKRRFKKMQALVLSELSELRP
jgi:ketol-acid reductoisomerase